MRFIFLFAVIPMILGCSGGNAEVSGTVTFNGQPLKMGNVRIAGADGKTRFGTIQSDGTYKVEGLPVGNAKVAVGNPDPNAPMRAGPGRRPDPKAPSEPAAKKVEGWQPIPRKYSNLLNSGLTLDIQDGENQFNIDLK